MMIVKVEPKYLEKNPSACHFFHQKSHVAYPGIKPGLLHWEARWW